VTLQEGSVKDTSGNPVPSKVLGTIEVSIPASSVFNNGNHSTSRINIGAVGWLQIGKALPYILWVLLVIAIVGCAVYIVFRMRSKK
jgi:ABC-type phosphate/phosphonate transport system permease subunit